VRRTERRESGQAIVEMALAAPVFFFVLFASLQLAVVVWQSYSVRNVTRETARWLALHPDSTDAAVAAQARALATPILRPDDMTSVVASPSCPSLSAGRCGTGRAPGDVVTVEIEYDLANALFLPTEYAGLTFPTRLPPYRVSVLVE
jgi:Flp pilus assembly protein TadG